jgi:hypothetical protein
MLSRYPSTAHHADGKDIGDILQAHSSGKICTGITAPVTAKSNNSRLKRSLFFHQSMKIIKGKKIAYILLLSMLNNEWL